MRRDAPQHLNPLGARSAELRVLGELERVSKGSGGWINEEGAWSQRTWALDHAELTAGKVQPIQGYGLIFEIDGSTPGARIDVECGGELKSFAPGDYFLGRFSEIRLKRASDSVATGSAKFTILRSPNVAKGSLRLLDSLRGTFAQSTVGPSGSTTQEASHASNNQPVAATDGVSLEGVSGVRIIVSAEATRTLSGGGELVFWNYSTSRSRWVEGATGYTIDRTGKRDLQFPDRVVTVKEGRLYVEARSVTVSGGTSVVVQVETFK